MDTRLAFLVLALPVILLQMTCVTSGQDLNGCGDTKGCFSQPEGCTGDDCMAYVTWETLADGQSRFSLRGQAQGWVAVGLRPSGSSGRQMVPADVYACTKNIEVKRSENVEGPDSDARTTPDNTLTGESVTFENNVITCTFTRQPSLAGDNTFYNISGDNQYFVLLAIGNNIGDNGNIQGNRHTERWSTSEARNLQTDFSPPTTEVGGAALPKAHASLMVIAWVGFASIGITLARFFKPMWPSSKLLGQKVWFTIHRMCMVTCVLCFCAAFILIFVHLQGFVPTSETLSLIHALCGIIVTCLGIINPIMAIFRPHPGTPNRPIFNWAHWGVGTTAHMLALVTVFIGIGYNSSGLLNGLHNYVFFVMVVFTGFHILMWILFEVQRCMTESQGRSNDVPLKTTGDRGNSDSIPRLTGNDSDPPSGSTAKSILLFIYVLGVVVIVGFLVISFIIA